MTTSLKKQREDSKRQRELDAIKEGEKTTQATIELNMINIENANKEGSTKTTMFFAKGGGCNVDTVKEYIEDVYKGIKFIDTWGEYEGHPLCVSVTKTIIDWSEVD